jgi:galactose mutarotase-like enzyme
MKALTNHSMIRHFQGFAVYVMGNESVEMATVPELGGKIISLRDLRTNREWLWHPKEGLKLFKNQLGDDFSLSPLVGMDECLPTILPCRWRHRQLPDHGEIWSQPWLVDDAAWQNGTLTAALKLSISPLIFKRTVELDGNELRFTYELANPTSIEERFVWALHPLLQLAGGDELELPDSTRRLLNGASWINAVTSEISERHCAKAFAHPVAEGWAAIKNEAAGDRLEFAWDPAVNNTLGLWLTRGGWHGHHHFAVEPTNANDDSLAVAAGRDQCGRVGGNSTVTWQLTLRVGL